MNEAISVFAGILAMIIIGGVVIGGMFLLAFGIGRLIRGGARRRPSRPRGDRYQQIDVKPDRSRSGGA